MAAAPYQQTRTFGQGSSSRQVSGTYFAPPTQAESLRAAQDKAYSVALGGGLRQLGVELPHAEGSNYLRPEQIAGLLALRGGADPGLVLGGASAPAAPGPSLADLFSTPFGQWSTMQKLGAAAAALAALALVRVVLR